MRGPDDQTSDVFSYLSPEQRVRADHPLRAIRRMTRASQCSRPIGPSELPYRSLGREALSAVTVAQPFAT